MSSPLFDIGQEDERAGEPHPPPPTPPTYTLRRGPAGDRPASSSGDGVSIATPSVYYARRVPSGPVSARLSRAAAATMGPYVVLTPTAPRRIFAEHWDDVDPEE